MKSHCNIASPAIYPEQRTIKRSGNTNLIKAKLCPRQFVKSTASLCLNKYSLAETEREHENTREGDWGGEDQVASHCSDGHLVTRMKQGETASARVTFQPRVPCPRGRPLHWEGGQQLRRLSQGRGGSHHHLRISWCLKRRRLRPRWILEWLVGQQIPPPLQRWLAMPEDQHEQEGSEQATALRPSPGWLELEGELPGSPHFLTSCFKFTQGAANFCPSALPPVASDAGRCIPPAHGGMQGCDLGG